MGDDLPVAVIGAGPIGLAAAAHLLERGRRPLILEAGPSVAATVRHWRHVRVFSPWCVDVDAAAVRLLAADGWAPPPAEDLPTGGELVDRYLEPLAHHRAVAPHLRLGHRVTAVARDGVDKVRDADRDARPFVLRVAMADGAEEELRAGVVIDASGTWRTPNPLGASGVPAIGEAHAGDHIVTGLPDVLGADHSRFAGRHTIVVGAGHSAATSLLALADLQQREPATRVTWAVRTQTPRPLVGKGADDELPARGRLGAMLGDLVATDRITVVTGFRTRVVEPNRDGVTLVDGDTGRRIVADQVIAATGFRPDHTMAAELRLRLDPALDSAAALAPLIDPNVHDCGSVPPHGARQLAHPEPGYWIVGTKSYGRAPTFLLATGYEQVRSVVAAVVGDQAAADEVRLVLPTDGGCPAHLPGTTPCRGGTRVDLVAA
jgi:cation diffusion facilitator CzcD-associated flavoprotein CzcO